MNPRVNFSPTGMAQGSRRVRATGPSGLLSGGVRRALPQTSARKRLSVLLNLPFMVSASPKPSGKIRYSAGPNLIDRFSTRSIFHAIHYDASKVWHNTYSRSMNAARVRVTSPPDKTYLSPFRDETTHGSRDPTGEAFLSRGAPFGFGNSAGMWIA
jgi:hypothetical protein